MKLPIKIKIFENKKLAEETTTDTVFSCGEMVLGIRTNNQILSNEGSLRIWDWKDKKFFWPIYRYDEEYFKRKTEADIIEMINKKFIEIPTLRKFSCCMIKEHKPSKFDEIKI